MRCLDGSLPLHVAVGARAPVETVAALADAYPRALDMPCQGKIGEKHAPPAFYYPPAADGSRGGIFYANTYLAETRGKFVMESIALHEAIPGHHFQIAIAQELAGMPWLRKQVQDFCTAYIEGWGLYTEKLGLEMGFYTDPCQDFGEF